MESLTVAHASNALQKQGCNMIFPCSLFREADGIRAEVYPEFEPILRDFCAQLHTDLFTPANLQRLHERFANAVCTEGYLPGNYDPKHHLLVYTADHTIPQDRKFPIYGQEAWDEYPDTTGFEPDEGAVSLAIVQDDAIVSAAGENLILRNGNLAEIAVVTTDGYRFRGYGAFLVRALANALTPDGLIAVYKTDIDNTPSQKTAVHAGFALTSEEYHFCYTRKD